MKGRFALFLSVLALLALYTGATAAQLWPAHPLAALAAPVLLVAALILWQIAYRRGSLPDESRYVRVLSWTASVGMGVWATFLLVSAGANVAAWLARLPASGAAWTAAAASGALAALGLAQAVRGPRVKEVSVRVPGLARALDGLRIVQISDLHVGPTIRRGYVELVVERALALGPDLIAVTGDLTDGTVERLAAHVAPLARLSAPLGVYYVTGNHEYYWGARDWLAKARELGFIPLVNEHRLLERAGARLLIGGIPDEQGRFFEPAHAQDLAAAAGSGAPADFRLLLAHRPDGVPAAERAGFDLQLSGHTHGGQFFPASLLIGLFHRYARGLARHGRMWVYVNQGTGYWGPAHRFAVPSEITLLTLRATGH